VALKAGAQAAFDDPDQVSFNIELLSLVGVIGCARMRAQSMVILLLSVDQIIKITISK
jgi:hypothetical protein